MYFEIIKCTFWCSSRFSLVIIGFFGCMNLYSLRVNMSVAIVCMTEDHEAGNFSRNNDSSSMPQENITGNEVNEVCFRSSLKTAFCLNIRRLYYGGAMERHWGKECNDVSKMSYTLIMSITTGREPHSVQNHLNKESHGQRDKHIRNQS